MDVSPWARTVFDRDVASEAASVKTTFSSWDACMEKSYCKFVPSDLLPVSSSLLEPS